VPDEPARAGSSGFALIASIAAFCVSFSVVINSRPTAAAARGRTRATGGSRPLPELLRLGAALLLLQSPLDGGLARLRRLALALDVERRAQLLDEPLQREVLVPELAPLVLCDGPEHRPRLRGHTPLLRLGQGRRALDVEHGLDARLRLLRVLAA